MGKVGVSVPGWHPLIDSAALNNILNKGRDAGYAQCGSDLPPIMAVNVNARNSSGTIIDALWFRSDDQWYITQNLIAPLINQENQQRAETEGQESEARRLAEQKEAARLARAKTREDFYTRVWSRRIRDSAGSFHKSISISG